MVFFVFFFKNNSSNVGTNTAGDQVVVSNGNLPITKHDMISYQSSDGKVNNHLPTVNGEVLTIAC